MTEHSMDIDKLEDGLARHQELIRAIAEHVANGQLESARVLTYTLMRHSGKHHPHTDFGATVATLLRHLVETVWANGRLNITGLFLFEVVHDHVANADVGLGDAFPVVSDIFWRAVEQSEPESQVQDQQGLAGSISLFVAAELLKSSIKAKMSDMPNQYGLLLKAISQMIEARPSHYAVNACLLRVLSHVFLQRARVEIVSLQRVAVPVSGNSAHTAESDVLLAFAEGSLHVTGDAVVVNWLLEPWVTYGTDSVPVLTSLQRANFISGNLEKSRKYMAVLQRLQPSNGQVQRDAALLQVESGHYLIADTMLQRILETETCPIAAIYRLKCLLALKQDRQAWDLLASFQWESITSDLLRPVADKLRSDLPKLLREKPQDNASGVLSALSERLNHPDWLTKLLMEALVREGQFQRAEAVQRAAMEASLLLSEKSPEPYLRLAAMYEGQNNREKAKAVLDQGLAVLPTDAAIWRKRLMLEAQTSDQAAAKLLFAAPGIKADENRYKRLIRVLIGVIQANAIELLQEYDSKLFNSFEDLIFLMHFSLENTGDPALGNLLLERAQLKLKQLEKKSRKARYLTLLTSWLQWGRLLKRVDLKKLQKKLGKHKYGAWLLSRIKTDALSKWVKQKAPGKTNLKGWKAYYELDVRIGRALLAAKQGQLHEAEKILREVLRHRRLIFQQLPKIKKIADILDNASLSDVLLQVTTQRFMHQSDVALARLLVDLGQTETGLKVLAQAMQDPKQESGASKQMAHYLRYLGHYHEAELILKTLLKESPEEARLYLELAEIAIEKGQVEETIQYARAARFYAYDDSEVFSVAEFIALLYQKKFVEAWRLYQNKSISAQLSQGILEGHYTKQYAEWCQAPHRLLVAVSGIGDEIRWASVYPKLSRKAGEQIAVTCDPRLLTIFQRSFPQLHFVPCARRYAAVTNHIGLEYSQVPHTKLMLLFDNTGWEVAGQYQRITLAHNILPDLLSDQQAFIRNGVLLKPDPYRVETWKAKFQASNNQPRIGITWRSDLMSYARNYHYLPFSALLYLMNHYAANWYILQGALSQTEKDALAAIKTGRVIFLNEEFDLNQDVENLAAVMTAMDHVIAPATFTLEFAGALGIPVSLISRSRQVEWRRGEQNIDIWFPNINHCYAHYTDDPLGVRLVNQLIDTLPKSVVEANPSDIDGSRLIAH